MTIETEHREIPVLLLTGYLGSGKTTLVNKILSNRRGIRFAVIVNDIGEVNIDADLIARGGIVGQTDDSLVALQNGCICCTLKMDLIQQLADLSLMNRFDYIVIEASGICEPGPIAQTIDAYPRIGPDYMNAATPVLDCIATVVDALRLKSEFRCGEDLDREKAGEEDIESLVIQQIEFCNKVILNKCSEVSAEELGRIISIIKALQPNAEIITCDWCEFDLDKIVGTGLFDFDAVATSAAWIDELEHGHEHEHGHHHGEESGMHNAEHSEQVEEYGIGTYVYYDRRALDINKFDYLVAKCWPRNIIRAKGICYFPDEPDRCFVFEQCGVQKSLKDAGEWYATMPRAELEAMLERDASLRRDWDPVYGDRMTKIVFIGQHIDKKALKEAMDACLQDCM